MQVRQRTPVVLAASYVQPSSCISMLHLISRTVAAHVMAGRMHPRCKGILNVVVVHSIKGDNSSSRPQKWTFLLQETVNICWVVPLASAGFAGIPWCTATFLALVVNSHLLVRLGANLFQHFNHACLQKLDCGHMITNLQLTWRMVYWARVMLLLKSWKMVLHGLCSLDLKQLS